MKTIRLVFSLCLALGLSLVTLRAQGGQMGPASTIDPVLAKLMADIKGFTATADITVVEATREVQTMIQCQYSYADNKFRADLDIGKMKSPDLPAEALPQLQMMGMAEFTTISNIEKGMIYFVYPGLKAYAEMPNPAAKKDPLGKDAKVQLTDLGQETVEGHACAKKKVAATADGSEVVIWLAKDLKDFPIKINVVDKKVAVTLVFKNVKLEVPPASLFAPPAGYTAYKNMQQMMQTEMMKKMGGMGR